MILKNRPVELFQRNGPTNTHHVIKKLCNLALQHGYVLLHSVESNIEMNV